MLMRLPEAARELGISYPTLKQWIYRGKIHSVKTAGGHHRISPEEVKRFLGRTAPVAQKQRGDKESRGRWAGGIKGRPGISVLGPHLRISGRNKLVGRVKEIQFDGLLARVVIAVGTQSITSIITREACLELDLKVGERAAALIKATEVMILK